MKIGDKCWCLSPSIESQNHGDYDQQPPWQGMIMGIMGKQCCYVAHFNPKTNAPDTDANAIAICDIDEIYASELDAKIRFKQWLECKIMDTESALSEMKKILHGLIMAEVDA